METVALPVHSVSLHHHPMNDLTPRQAQITAMLNSGKSVSLIATSVGLTIKQTESAIRNLKKRSWKGEQPAIDIFEDGFNPFSSELIAAARRRFSNDFYLMGSRGRKALRYKDEPISAEELAIKLRWIQAPAYD